jgi:putative NADPH-quinone reductase
VSKKILVIDGHPDPKGPHFVHELADFYRKGAKEGGHTVRLLRVGELRFPLIRNHTAYLYGKVPESIRAAQKAIVWADHVAVLYPLWLGTVPAKLKGFLEQVMRPGFGFAGHEPGGMPRRLLTGRSARIIVTRGMPELFEEVDRSERSIQSVAGDVLGLCGVRPVRVTVLGGADTLTPAQHDKARFDMRRLGLLAR